MCGRISTAELSAATLKAHFGLETVNAFSISYNIPPGLRIPAIRVKNGSRSLESLHWGLIPHWAKDRAIAEHTFNARLETLTEKPSFREAIKARRCIVPASGFYEWQQQAARKQPFYIHRSDRRPLALAGLWEHWLDGETGERIESCSLITMPASYQMAEIHARMPAIIEPAHFALWLDPRFHDPYSLQEMLKAEEHVLELYPVSPYVSNSAHDGEKCIKPFM